MKAGVMRYISSIYKFSGNKNSISSRTI